VQRLPRTLRLVGLGWYIAFCLVAGIVGGLWLDDQVHLKPLFLLLGLALGLIAAFYGTIRMLATSVEE
jgi:F0F1-type ATP synthase assembly protein I